MTLELSGEGFPSTAGSAVLSAAEVSSDFALSAVLLLSSVLSARLLLAELVTAEEFLAEELASDEFLSEPQPASIVQASMVAAVRAAAERSFMLVFFLKFFIVVSPFLLHKVCMLIQFIISLIKLNFKLISEFLRIYLALFQIMGFCAFCFF